MKFYLIVLSLLAVCLWGTGDVRAQSASRSMTVTGKVVDQNGAAVTGASVVVVGTTKGTTTGADGAFSLTGVASDARLAVNFIGYKTQTVEVGGRTSFNIVLVEEATAVDEVVVVGYGTQKKVNLTGAIATVDEKQLQNRSAPSVAHMLQGSVPGLTVSTSSGRPGNPASLNIRGITSINGGSPLVLVDGIDSASKEMEIASIELFDGGPSVTLSIGIPPAVTQGAGDLVHDAADVVRGLVGSVTGARPWE